MRQRSMLLVGLLLPGLAFSQGSPFAANDRADRWEAFFQVNHQGSELISGDEDTFADFSSDTGFGLGLGYHFSEHFYLGADVLFNSPSYDAQFTVDEDGNGEPDGIQRVSHKADFFTSQLRGTWHLLDGNFTPFLEGAIGLTYVDSNVTDRPPVTGCWWDPWWGYICRPFYSTYSDWNFSYSWGAGLRMDFNPQFSARLAYTQRYLDLGESSDPSFDTGSLDFIWRF